MTDPLLTAPRAARFFPWLAHDPETGIFLLDDNHIGAGFACDPLSGFDSAMEQRFRALLTHEFPVGTFLQFNLCVFDDVMDHIDRIAQERNISRDPLIRRSTLTTMRFLHDAATGAGSLDMPVRNARMIITLKMPIREPLPAEEEMTTLSRLRRELATMLATIGFADLRPLTDADLLHQLSVILNRGPLASWRRGAPPRPDPARFLRDEVLDFDTPVKIMEDALRIGETTVTSLSIRKFPDRAPFGLARSFSVDPARGNRGIPCAHMISGTILFQDVTEERPRLERRRQTTGFYADGPFGRILPEYRRRKHDLDLVGEALAEGQFVHKISLNITLFSPDPDQAQMNTTRTRTYLAELGCIFLQDSCITFPLLIANCPFGPTRRDIRNLARHYTMTSDAIAVMMPLFFEWRGTPTPLVSLIGRGGQLMGYSPWDSSTNYNLTISAESGAGKSFLSNELISAVLGAGGKVWVIDVGLSYQKLCESLGGQFLRFAPDSDICLNPFSSLQTQAEFDEVADILLSLVTAMAAPRAGLDDFQSSILARVIREEFARNGADMCIDDLAQALFAEATRQTDADQKEKRISDIAHGLARFCRGGPYGRYFNGPATIDFHASLVCLELEELKSQKHLQQIVLLLLIYQIQQGMYLGPRTQKKLLLIDEAWDLLADDRIAAFIEAGYRRFRKYNGAACVVTQSLLDLTSSRTGQAITANSSSLIMLKQNEGTLNKLSSGEAPEVDPRLAEWLKTVHTVPGRYSEVFIRTAWGAGIGRFVVDPFTALLYSTNPRDTGAIAREVARGLPVHEAITAVLNARSAVQDKNLQP